MLGPAFGDLPYRSKQNTPEPLDHSVKVQLKITGQCGGNQTLQEGIESLGGKRYWPINKKLSGM